MNDRDETFRAALTDLLARAHIDARNLAIEVGPGQVMLKGTVGSAQDKQRLDAALSAIPAGCVVCDVAVRPIAASDSPDGRGRSPVTGTSAESAQASRHQLDRN